MRCRQLRLNPRLEHERDGLVGNLASLDAGNGVAESAFERAPRVGAP